MVGGTVASGQKGGKRGGTRTGALAGAGARPWQMRGQMRCAIGILAGHSLIAAGL